MRAGTITGGLGALLLVAAASASTSVANAQPPDGGAPAPPSPPSIPACVAVGTDARYVPYGYNHVVVLRNGCSKAVTCNVSTDVNPQATSVDVASGTTVEVLTFTASPAQTFVAHVTCKLH